MRDNFILRSIDGGVNFNTLVDIFTLFPDGSGSTNDLLKRLYKTTDGGTRSSYSGKLVIN
ncbi:MAG: hypothetical protein COA97_08005 [Flavobacteriales bacterium]|nr:MAG: hypothetical protein COA97_08005 [Flavobacteriales bacterium]